MDLINDLSSDLVFAVFVEKRHQQKIDVREAKSLIARVESELLSAANRKPETLAAAQTEPPASPLSH